MAKIGPKIRGLKEIKATRDHVCHGKDALKIARRFLNRAIRRQGREECRKYSDS